MADSMDSSPQWFDPTGGSGRVTARYGQAPSNAGQWTGKGVHTGVDYGLSAGSSAYALGGGTVKSAGFDPTVGNYVEIEVSPGKTYRYAHLNQVDVKAGDVVKGGQQVGLVGNTGSSSRGAHLHTEFTLNNDFVSPELFYGGSKNVPKFAASTYVPGAKQSLGRAFTYKGQPTVKYEGGLAGKANITPAGAAPTVPQNLGTRLTSSATSQNVVRKIY